MIYLIAVISFIHVGFFFTLGLTPTDHCSVFKDVEEDMWKSVHRKPHPHWLLQSTGHLCIQFD